MIVDSTVQHKAIAHSTDSRLLESARAKLVEAAEDAEIDFKQTFAKKGKALGRKAGRYAHARQRGRMLPAIKRQLANHREPTTTRDRAQDRHRGGRAAGAE